MQLSYVQYKNAVLRELRDKMTQAEYDNNIESRIIVIENIIMDEHDRPSMDKPSPQSVASSIMNEFAS